MAKFIQIPSFAIYDKNTGEWAKPEHFWLNGSMVYQTDLLNEEGKTFKVKIPHGFYTDFASIPRFPPLLRHVFIKNGKHRPAAVPHDYLCRLSYVKDFEDPMDAFPRRLADKVFLEAMGVVGVKRWKRYLMYWAVRANTERLILMGKVRR